MTKKELLILLMSKLHRDELAGVLEQIVAEANADAEGYYDLTEYFTELKGD